MALGIVSFSGGWHFDDSAVVDDEVMAKILEVAPLAPLHNYGEAAAIEYCREKYPELPNVAVFDTSFHMTMPRGRLHLRAAQGRLRQVPRAQVRRPRHEPPL